MERSKIGNWSAEEDDFIRCNYQVLSAKEISLRISRTFTSVQNRIKRLGLKKSAEAKLKQVKSLSQKKEDRWSEDELKFLIDNYQNMSGYRISQHLGRSRGSVSYQVFRLKLKRPIEKTREINAQNNKPQPSSFSTEDDKIIIDKWTTMAKSDIANIIGRSGRGSILSRGRRLGLKLTKSELKEIYKKGRLKDKRSWRPDEIDYLIENYSTLPSRLIAKKINKNSHCITDKASELGLKLTEEQKIAKSLRLDYYPDSFIASRLTRNRDLQQEIIKHPSLLNLKRTLIILKRKIKQL